ncbi:MAG: aromatic amino acid lyase, partial [Pseudomonadota bacterium]
MNIHSAGTALIGLQPVGIDTFQSIVLGKTIVAISEDAVAAVKKSQAVMDQAIDQGRRIYGINTGFGALGHKATDSSELNQLQQNLIYHLATGVGEPFSWENARALCAARLIVLARGASGCPIAVIGTLCEVLNAGLAPVVPSKGTVGASGDLTPSAHMTLALL